MTDTIETLKAEVAALQKRIDEMEKQEKAKDDGLPKRGDEYFFLDSFRVDSDIWAGCNVDSDRKKRGPMFRTRDEAERADKLRIIRHKLATAKGAREFVEGEKNWVISLGKNRFEAAYIIYHKCPFNQYFDSQENATAAYKSLTRDEQQLLKEYA